MDDDIRELRRNVKPAFEKKFRKAYNFYLQGEWIIAKEHFFLLNALDPEDGPTLILKMFIDKHNGKAPANWQGCR